jgi:murein DD-endopeptidase MepM/ murein hydrolase activator NlpD
MTITTSRTAALVLAICATVILSNVAYAESASSTLSALQAQIDAHNSQISQINTEIAQYQKQLSLTDKKKQTLQNTLKQIDLSIQKTSASIHVTQNKISATQLQILQLAAQINVTGSAIKRDQAALAESIRNLSSGESQQLIVTVLSEDNIAAAWSDIDYTESLRNALKDQVTSLQGAQESLSSTKSSQEAKNAQLVEHTQVLQAQQGSLSATKQSQADLLQQTKAQEATYQAIIAQKRAQEASFESALADLKASANKLVSANQITAAVAGTLQWPIEGQITISQFFGNTHFADAHASLYSGHGHDGLDITARIGTPVHAALSGIVIGSGNTDATPGCQGGSFGKWVMIKHENGLNTMYAHLSQINVSQAQTVTTGDVIGYSGETGYATGPHLHFGVYVSSVTQIVSLGTVTRGTSPCSRAIMPVPPVSGYLNPLNYLPETLYKKI